MWQNVDIIVPIPSHWTRCLYRGHNPVSLIAHEVSELTGIPALDALGSKFTPKQQGKTPEQRQQNVLNKFYIRKNVTGLSVAIIDDVMTTGATLNEAVQVLRTQARKVVCVTALRTKN